VGEVEEDWVNGEFGNCVIENQKPKPHGGDAETRRKPEMCGNSLLETFHSTRQNQNLTTETRRKPGMGRWETGFAVANGKASITIIFDDDVAREEIRRRDAALPRLTVATLKILKD
jgi:hypothetical protein